MENREKYNVDKDWLYQKYFIEKISIGKLMTILNCSSDVIYHRMKKFDFKLKPRKTNSNKGVSLKADSIDIEFFKQKYYEEKMNLREICLLLDCCGETIRKFMKKNGFKIRSQKGRKASQETIERLKKIGKENAKKILIDKDWLYEQYFIKMRSMSNIALELKISEPTVQARMLEFGFVRRNRSESKLGKLNPMFGLTGEKSPKYGKPLSPEALENLKANIPRGEKNHNYKKPEDRIDPINNQIRNCQKSKDWKRKVLARDKFICTMCKSSKNLHVDHIKPFALIKLENNIKSLEGALLCEELWNINNGRTLCKECHEKTDTWASGTYNLIKKLKEKQ